MLPKPFCAELLAFILLIAVSERSLHAGGRQSNRRNQEEGTSRHHESQMGEESETGHSETHTSVHEEHAGPSDPESVRFWENLDDELDTTSYHFGSVVTVVGATHYTVCMGSLVQLNGANTTNGDIKVIVPWSCGQTIMSSGYYKIITYDNVRVQVWRDRLMQFRYPVNAVAAFDVLNDVKHLMPVRLAKPNMPLDGTVFGVGITLEGHLMSVGVVDDESHCGIRDEYGPVTCFCARDEENNEAIRGSPFLVKSSGEWYLAGIHDKFYAKKEDLRHHILGGNEYTILNDIVEIVPLY